MHVLWRGYGDDVSVSEKNVEEVLRHEGDGGIEKNIEKLFDRLAGIVTLLHEKGIITEEEIFNLSQIEPDERYYAGKGNYHLDYIRNTTYNLVHYYIDPDAKEDDYFPKVLTKIVATGTIEEMKAKRKELLGL